MKKLNHWRYRLPANILGWTFVAFGIIFALLGLSNKNE